MAVALSRNGSLAGDNGGRAGVAARVLGICGGIWASLVLGGLLVDMLNALLSKPSWRKGLWIIFVLPVSPIILALFVMSLWEVGTYLVRARSSMPLRLGLAFALVWCFAVFDGGATAGLNLTFGALIIPQFAAAYLQPKELAADGVEVGGGFPTD